MRGSEKCSRSRIAWLKRSPDERLQAAADSDIFAARGKKRERGREIEKRRSMYCNDDRRRETDDDQASGVSASSCYAFSSPYRRPFFFFFRETLMDLRHVEHMAIRSLMTLMDD